MTGVGGAHGDSTMPSSLPHVTFPHLQRTCRGGKCIGSQQVDGKELHHAGPAAALEGWRLKMQRLQAPPPGPSNLPQQGSLRVTRQWQRTQRDPERHIDCHLPPGAAAALDRCEQPARLPHWK